MLNWDFNLHYDSVTHRTTLWIWFSAISVVQLWELRFSFRADIAVFRSLWGTWTHPFLSILHPVQLEQPVKLITYQHVKNVIRRKTKVIRYQTHGHSEPFTNIWLWAAHDDILCITTAASSVPPIPFEIRVISHLKSNQTIFQNL